MNIYDFKSNLIKFTTKKIISGRCIWADLDALDKVEPLANIKWDQAAFLDHFAYVIEGNQHFEEIEYAAEVKDMYAEIYGGSVNGGSGRAGNLGLFQVKGVGQTMLVGKRADSWHAYGCFSMVEALLETLNSVVLNEILPCGTARCFGLIMTGEITAWPPHSDVAGRGALLVRELCLRPAHFFCNDKFSPKEKHKHLFSNDKLRIKKVTQKLSTLVNGPEGYDQFLKKFLDNYANQFSYAKIFRIFHGAINGSNVSLDGRWLDLTTASFVDSGKNYVGAENIPSFYAEHCTVLNFVETLINLYKVYNVAAPRKDDLVKYYTAQFKWHMHKHVLTLLGLASDSYSAESISENNDFSLIVAKVWNTIVQKDTFVKELPSVLPDSDPLLNLLEGWFSLLYKSLTQSYAGNESDCESDLAFLRFVNKFRDENFQNIDRISFFCSMTIKSLKKAYFSEFFFKKRIEIMVTNNINTSDLNFFFNVVEDCKKVAIWAFSDKRASVVTLYESIDLSVLFSEDKNMFEVVLSGDKIEFNSALDLLNFLNSMDGKYFIICDYSFKKYLIMICKILCGNHSLRAVSSPNLMCSGSVATIMADVVV